MLALNQEALLLLERALISYEAILNARLHYEVASLPPGDHSWTRTIEDRNRVHTLLLRVSSLVHETRHETREEAS